MKCFANTSLKRSEFFYRKKVDIIIKVSIVIPVYNVEKYLEECIESAIKQSLNDIEIICINDGSTDSSLEILKKYEEKYSNIIVISQENKGLSASRNVGIRKAKGKYIYFLDSDDFIDTKSMEVCYKECEKYDLDMVTFDAICFLDKDYVGKDFKEDYDRSNLLPQYTLTGEEFYIASNKSGGYRVPVWLNFYNSEFIRKNNLFFIEGIYHEDEIHTCHCLLKAKRIKYINKKFFNRRIRNNSIMTSNLNKKHIHGNFEVFKELYKIYCIYGYDRSTEVGNILYHYINLNIKSTLSRCDFIKEEELRKEVINFLRSNTDIVDISTDIYANKLALYYSLK